MEKKQQWPWQKHQNQPQNKNAEIKKEEVKKVELKDEYKDYYLFLEDQFVNKKVNILFLFPTFKQTYKDLDSAVAKEIFNGWRLNRSEVKAKYCPECELKNK